MLEFGAIDFDDGTRAAEENFGGSLHNSRLARACRPEEEKISYRPPRGIQAGRKNLKQFDKCLNAFILAHNLLAQGLLKLNGLCAPNIRI
jgi:hypothetical protein